MKTKLLAIDSPDADSMPTGQPSALSQWGCIAQDAYS